MGRHQSIATFATLDFPRHPGVAGFPGRLIGLVRHHLLANPKPQIRRDKALAGGQHQRLAFQVRVLILGAVLAPVVVTSVCPYEVGGIVVDVRPLALEKLVNIQVSHMASVYALLSEFPGAKQIAAAHLTRLKALLMDASRGRYGRDMAAEIRDAARCSVGSKMPAKSLELQHTIRLIRELDAEIEEIEAAIQAIMDELHSPITTIPGIGYCMGAMILAEIGDFSRFASPDKLLAYAGMSPSTYQSGQLKNCYPHMEKRGSRYLRYALYNAAKYVCQWDPTFAAYLAKKRAEGKHYNVALSHAAKKLVRLIFALEKSRQPYCPAI